MKFDVSRLSVGSRMRLYYVVDAGGKQLIDKSWTRASFARAAIRGRSKKWRDEHRARVYCAVLEVVDFEVIDMCVEVGR
jgi:hypothetical protein